MIRKLFLDFGNNRYSRLGKLAYLASLFALPLLGSLLLTSEFLICWFKPEVNYYPKIVSSFISGGLVPYRDFHLEYPPGIFFYFLMFSIFPINYFVFAYQAFNYLLTFLVLFKERLLGKQRAYAVAILSLLTMFIFFRNDILPTVLIFLSYRRFLNNKIFLSGLLLGLSISSKIFPIFLLPIFLIFLFFGRSRRGGILIILKYLSGIFFGIAFPFFLLWTSGGKEALFSSFDQVFSYYLNRGVNIESIWGGAFLLVKRFQSAFLIEMNFASWNVVGFPKWLLKISLPLTGLFFGGLYLLFIVLLKDQKRAYRRKIERVLEEKVLCRAILLAVFLLLFLNKVFSPQYLIWPLFFIFELGRLENYKILLPSKIYAVIIVFTIIELIFYGNLQIGSMWTLILLNLRNIFIGVMIVSLLRLMSPVVMSGAEDQDREV